MQKARWFIAFSILFLFSFISWAEETNPATVKIQAEAQHIAAFKNGIGVIRLIAPLPSSNDATYQIYPVPKATLGSFWLINPPGSELKDVKITKTRVNENVPAANIAELLEANIGKQVGVKINETWTEVTIKDVPKRHDQPILLPKETNVISPPPPPERGDMVLMEENGRVWAVLINSIKEVHFHANQSSYELAMPKEEEVIEFTIHFNKKEEGKEKPAVSIVALSKGIAWSPSYVVDITDEKSATITAKSVVVNDLIGFKDTAVELITGYPHIVFDNVNDAFSLLPLQQVIEQISAGRPMERYYAGVAVMSQKAVLANTAGDFMAPPAPSEPVMGEQEEDLFFYQADKITLKKGERAYQVLFSEKIPYEHVYTWDIPDQIDQFAPYRQEPQTQKGKEIVWHSLKLTNSTAQPWTTAPAITMKDNRILGQDIVAFTPQKGSTELKITQAISVNAEQNEYEIDRQRNAANFYGMPHDLVKVKGELLLTNFKPEAIKIKISKTLSGEILDAAKSPEVKKLAAGLRKVNPTSQLIWNAEVKSGKDNQLKLEYTYQVYVHN